MLPKPGPTFEIALAAPEIEVKKSRPDIDSSIEIIKKRNKKEKIKTITDFINLSVIFWLLYLTITILLGDINFLISFFINKKSICTLNIFIPQAVDPAHPPINIKNKKKINENFPQSPKSSVT